MSRYFDDDGSAGSEEGEGTIEVTIGSVPGGLKPNYPRDPCARLVRDDYWSAPRRMADTWSYSTKNAS